MAKTGNTPSRKSGEGRRSTPPRTTFRPPARTIAGPSDQAETFFLPVRQQLLETFRHLLPQVLLLATLTVGVLGFHVYSWRNYEGPKRAWIAFGVIMVVAVGYLANGKYRERFVSPVGLPLQLLVFGAALSTLFAANIAEGMEDLLDFIFRFGLMFMFMRYAATWFDARRYLFLALFVGLLAAVYGVCQQYGVGAMAFIFSRIPVSTGGNINYASELLNITGMVAVGLLLYSLGRRNYAAAALCAIKLTFALWALYYTDSRASHVGIITGLLIGGLAWLYYRGMGRVLLCPTSFRFRPVPALIILLLTVPVLNQFHVNVINKRTNEHQTYAMLMQLTGLDRTLRAIGQRADLRRAERSRDLTVSELDPAYRVNQDGKQVPVVSTGRLWNDFMSHYANHIPLRIWLLPIDNVQYRLIVRGILGALAMCLAWWWLDKRGYLGGLGDRPLGVEHIAARLALIAVWILWMAVAYLPTGAFFLVLLVGVVGLLACAGLACAFWLGVGQKLATLPIFFSGFIPLALGICLFTVASGAAWRVTGLLLAGLGLMALFSLIGHWWHRPAREAMAKPALIVALLAVFLLGAGLGVNKALHNDIIVETMNSRLPERHVNINTILFRFEVYKSTVATITNNVLVGIGAGNFKVIHELYTSQIERFVLGREVLARKVHNTPISYAVEYGIIGFFGFVWFVFAFAKLCLRLMWWGTRGCRYETSMAFAGPRQEAAFHVGLIGLAVLACVMVNDLFGHTVIMPASAAMFWGVLGIICGVGPRLMGLPMPAQAHVVNPEHPVARLDRALPPMSPKRYAGLCIVATLLFLWPAHQFMGEAHLRRAMMVEDYKVYEGYDVTTQPRWGEPDALRYAMKRYLPSPMEREVYAGMGVFDHFRHAHALFPWQMEMYYIVGRYYIDAVQEILDADSARGRQNTVSNRLIYFNKLYTMALYGLYPIESAQRLYPYDAEGEVRADLPSLEEYRSEYWRYSGIDPRRQQRYIDRGVELYLADLYLNPNYKWAHNNIGVLMDRKEGSVINPNQPSLSREAYLRALVIDPEQIYAHYNLGLGYSREGNFAKAGMYFESAVFTEADKWDAYHPGVQCFEQIGNFDRAMALYDRYAYYNSIIDATYANFVRTRRYAPRTQRPYPLIQAITRVRGAYEGRTDLADENTDIFFSQLGLLYERLDDPASAKLAYHWAVQALPGKAEYRKLYANFLLADGEWEQAQAQLMQLVGLYEQTQQRDGRLPDDYPNVLYELGRSSIFLGQVEGVTILQRALRGRPDLRERASTDLELRQATAQFPQLDDLLRREEE